MIDLYIAKQRIMGSRLVTRLRSMIFVNDGFCSMTVRVENGTVKRQLTGTFHRGREIDLS